jgi:hypothetical protein
MGPGLPTAGAGPYVLSMKLRGGSFGLLGLLVVLAIVLVLVAKNWQMLADNMMSPGRDAHGEHEAAEQVQAGELPDLQQTQAASDDHTNEVNAALEQID